MGNLCREPPELVGEEYGRRVIVQAHPRHCCCCCCGPTATAAAAVGCAHSSGLLLGRGCGRQGGIHPVVDSQALEGAAGVQEVHDGLGVDGLPIGIPIDPAAWHGME